MSMVKSFQIPSTKIDLSPEEVSFLRWIKSAGMISNAGGKDYDNDPLVVALEKKEMLIMTYFGDRKTGPLRKWFLTSKAIGAIGSKKAQQ